MNRKVFALLALAALSLSSAFAKDYSATSPDGRISVSVSTGETLSWSLAYDGRQVVAPSEMAVRLTDGTVWGGKAKVSKAVKSSRDEVLPSPFYRRASVKNRYNSLELMFKGNWSIEFRVFDDGAAYRFKSRRQGRYEIENEDFKLVFPEDYPLYAPYVRPGKDGDFESQFPNSFENLYTETRVSGMNPKRLSFVPVLAKVREDVRLCISESDVEAYPGMFLLNPDGGTSLKGVFAPYPHTQAPGGYNNIQIVISEREKYIAEVEEPRNFPWRMFVVGNDVAVAESDMTWLLAEPSKIEDTSWIRPGKVAWEWWNAWNIKGVDFKAGINTATYKYYIDFASANKIEYIILDNGWAAGKGEDLMILNPDIDLEEIVSYAASKGVGVILWAGVNAFKRDMENVCRHYSEMGVKGFKIDFLDRDDQYMNAFEYQAAEMAAKYQLVLDIHGAHKPAGMNRTFPNILNMEGVHGLETVKWTPATSDQVHYDVTLPFTRQVAGPMDYTPGAMLNASRKNFKPIHDEPMSQGTRCHQLALYMVLDAPLNMLCDSPSHYIENQECCDFISAIPTVWDETVVLDGKVGEYVITARRKGDTWYVGGITDWTERDLTLNLSFLSEGSFKAEIFKDGVNADRMASDYIREVREVSSTESLTLHLAPGGGFAVSLVR